MCEREREGEIGIVLKVDMRVLGESNEIERPRQHQCNIEKMKETEDETNSLFFLRKKNRIETAC